MIRLKRAYLFQEIKCGEGNRTEAIKTFTSDANEQDYRGTMLKADLMLDPATSLVYIREHATQRIHITTTNNLKSCIPFEEDVPDVWSDIGSHDKNLAEIAPMKSFLPKKRMGRPPKVKAEDASSSIT